MAKKLTPQSGQATVEYIMVTFMTLMGLAALGSLWRYQCEREARLGSETPLCGNTYETLSTLLTTDIGDVTARVGALFYPYPEGADDATE
jgi:hypothetical protein